MHSMVADDPTQLTGPEELARLGPAEAEDTLRDLGLLEPDAFHKDEVEIRQQENPVLSGEKVQADWGEGKSERAPDWQLNEDQIDKELQQMIDQHQVPEEPQGGNGSPLLEEPMHAATGTPTEDQTLNPLTPADKVDKSYDQQLPVKQESTWNDSSYGLSSNRRVSMPCNSSPPSAAYGIPPPTSCTPTVSSCHTSPTSTSHSYSSNSAVTSHAGPADFLELAYSSMPAIKSEPRSAFMGQYDEGEGYGAGFPGCPVTASSALHPPMTSTGHALHPASTVAFTSPIAGPSFNHTQRSVLSSPFSSGRRYTSLTYIDPPNPGSSYTPFLSVGHQKDYASLHSSASLSRPQSMISPHHPSYSHTPTPLYLPQPPTHSNQLPFAQHQYPGYPHASTAHHPHSMYPGAYPPTMYPESAMPGSYYPGSQMHGMSGVRVKQEPGGYFGHCPY